MFKYFFFFHGSCACIGHSKICEKCAYVIQLESQKRFDPFGRRPLSVNHLLEYGMVLEASYMSALCIICQCRF